MGFNEELLLGFLLFIEMGVFLNLLSERRDQLIGLGNLILFDSNLIRH